MDRETMELMERTCLDLLFNHRWCANDILVLVNWVQDHRPVRVYRHKNNFLTLSYCGRCSTIVGEGDKFCSNCGRGLIWDD